MNILRSILLGLLFLLGVRGDICLSQTGEAEIEPPKPGMSVAEFVSAYYDVYVIDTSGVEPTVLVTIVTTDGDTSQLDTLGIDTDATILHNVKTAIPVRLVDSVIALGSVDTVLFQTWDHRMSKFIEDHYSNLSIDTTGEEPSVGLIIQTNGDLSQLDSAGIDTTGAIDGSVMRNVPLGMVLSIRDLETVEYAIYGSNDIRLASEAVSGFRASGYGAVAGLFGRRYCSLGLEFAFRSASSSNGYTEEISQGFTLPMMRHAHTNPAGFVLLDSIQVGTYTVVIQLPEPHTFAPESHSSAATQVCATLACEGVRVAPDSVSIIHMNFDTASKGTAISSADSSCAVVWEERLLPLKH